MNRDQIRALIGGYATGSLTEAEKTALFEAALDDQELFDELAREQALKEVIDQPGVRQRLIASLEPPPAAAWWKRPWPWAAAASLMVAMAIASFMLRPIHRTEVVRVEPPRIEPLIESAPPAVPAPAPSSVPKRTAPISKSPAKGGIAAQARAQKDTAIAETSSGAAPPGAAPSPPPAPPRAQQRTVGSLGAVAPGFLPKPFGFHYAVDWTGDVTVTADSDGYLRVLANQGDSSLVLFPGAYRRVLAGSTTQVAVPPRVDAVLIEFYASPPPPNDGTPYTETADASGAVSDPAPSPDSKLRIRIVK